MRLLLSILLWVTLLKCGAATWYVRPGVHSSWNATSPAHPIPTIGVYGNQDGTTYANAWNGLESIVWGASGVNSGDTLYVCGAHIYALSNYNYAALQATIPIDPSGSGCTIRMDYPPDPGLMFGGAFDRVKVYPWQGPDANGVYFATNWWNSAAGYGIFFEVDGANITRLTTTNVSTWTGNLGYWAQVGNSNYIKTVDGSAPTTNIALNADGWRFKLPLGLSNVTFLNCSFIAGSVFAEDVIYPPGDVPTNYLANHITFRNCLFRESDLNQAVGLVMMSVNPGNDYWTFDGCEIGYGPSGVYSNVGFQSATNQTRGVVCLVVTNCYIHDLDTLNNPAIDGHAIGAQDNSGCVFAGNRIERTGTAIALFSYGMGMSNNLISGNFIKDTHWHIAGGTTGGEGIWLSAQVQNIAVSNRIYDNIVLNAGLPGVGAFQSWVGSGIASSVQDWTDFANNTVMNAQYGINLSVNGVHPNGRIENNIIANITNNCIKIGNVAGAVVDCDYNLFYTNIVVPSAVFSITGSLTHDTHSIYGNPLLASLSPSTANDFKLQIGSPARGAGIPILATDYAGLPFANPPSIGAFEFESSFSPISLTIGKAIFGP